MTQSCNNCSGYEGSIMTYMIEKQRLQQPYSPHPMLGGGSPQLYYHDCSGTTSQVTPQGCH